MKTRLLILSLVLIHSLHPLMAQRVEKVIGPVPRINNGVLVDDDGTIYGCDLFGSGFDGTRIYQISPDGQTSKIFADGLTRPAGMAFDANGLLYVAEFGSGEVSTVDTNGQVTQFASGFPSPSGLAFDTAGYLYVTNYGNGTVSRVSPAGVIRTLTSGIDQPVGIAFDDRHRLYVVSLRKGNLWRIDTAGAKTLVATLPDLPVGFMCFAKGKLYVCATGNHRIYEVELDGTFRVYAGTGQLGTVNGPVDSARFTNPDGIAASPTGDTLYISENNTNLLRRIVPDRDTIINSLPDHSSGEWKLNSFPNPSSGNVRIDLEVMIPSQIRLVGSLGQELWSESIAAGNFHWQLNGDDYPKGIYFLELRSGAELLESRKIVLQ
ncbi:SMP-30/gluconolactonase/LRE family protein [bacterium SCSIO 12741]|nr:SMP-30/gluconolactonase/LRE family protein [bacterium SCSIO 12741]